MEGNDVLGKRPPFPLLADHTQFLTRKLDLLDANQGAAKHAYLLIDPKGLIRHKQIGDGSVGFDVQEVLEQVITCKAEIDCKPFFDQAAMEGKRHDNFLWAHQFMIPFNSIIVEAAEDQEKEELPPMVDEPEVRAEPPSEIPPPVPDEPPPTDSEDEKPASEAETVRTVIEVGIDGVKPDQPNVQVEDEPEVKPDPHETAEPEAATVEAVVAEATAKIDSTESNNDDDSDEVEHPKSLDEMQDKLRRELTEKRKEGQKSEVTSNANNGGGQGQEQPPQGQNKIDGKKQKANKSSCCVIS